VKSFYLWIWLRTVTKSSQSQQSALIVSTLPSYQLESLIYEILLGPENSKSFVFIMSLTYGLTVMLVGKFIILTDMSYNLIDVTTL
jgi:hypothetical protein